MIWRNSCIGFLLGIGMTATATAGTLDINISRDVVEAGYGMPVGSGELRFGALYHDVTHDWLAHVGFLGRGEGSSSIGRTSAGLGGRLYSGPVGAYDVFALALGGEFSLYPGDGYVGLGGYAYYAPNVLSGRDAQRFSDIGIRGEIEIIKRTGFLYIGYRDVRTHLTGGGNARIDHSSHIGLRISF